MATGTVSYIWRDQNVYRDFKTGVSLHSHTNQSCETLDFLASFANKYAVIRSLLSRLEFHSERKHGVRIDYASSYWTPPMTPKLAFDLESQQIQKLGLNSMVSITDHDTIAAPMLLSTIPGARHIPVSLEWSVPYGGVQDFHLGVHNLPSNTAKQWMRTLAEFTAKPNEPRLREILIALNDEPDVLVVFNHPMWDLFMLGRERHTFLVNEFLQTFGASLHALELNGLRNWEENRATRRLAERWNMVLISGGDRHGVEPNANINLTNATNFTEFVHEIRRDRMSNVLFMPQYAQPWKYRLLHSTLDAIRDYPQFPQGSRRWDERAYHPDGNGVIRPLSEIWPNGRAPIAIQSVIKAVQTLGSRPVSRGLRFVWKDASQLRLALGDQEI